MTDERLRRLYELAMADRAGDPEGCAVPTETMLDVLEGRLSDAEHRRALAAIMSHPRCRREFDLLRAAAGARPLAATRGRPAWPMRIAAGLVVAIGVGTIWYVQQPPAADPMRDRDTSAVRLVSPSEGDHSRAGMTFVWRAIPEAVAYRFTLVTAGGRLIHGASLVDTSLVLPDSVGIDGAEDLRWWVEATTEDGAQFRAELRRLRLINP